MTQRFRDVFDWHCFMEGGNCLIDFNGGYQPRIMIH